MFGSERPASLTGWPVLRPRAKAGHPFSARAPCAECGWSPRPGAFEHFPTNHGVPDWPESALERWYTPQQGLPPCPTPRAMRGSPRSKHSSPPFHKVERCVAGDPPTEAQSAFLHRNSSQWFPPPSPAAASALTARPWPHRAPAPGQDPSPRNPARVPPFRQITRPPPPVWPHLWDQRYPANKAPLGSAER